MNKILFVFLTIIFLLGTDALSRPPRVTGNFERGSRYALAAEDSDFLGLWTEPLDPSEQETWAYNFHKGFLQVAQVVNPSFRYAVRFNWNWKDFPHADEELNNRNIMRYYRSYCWITLSRYFALRLEYYLRDQDYKVRSWDNLTHVPSMQLRWDIDRERRRRANFYLRLNSQRYVDSDETWKDKDHWAARVNYQEQVHEKLLLKTQYSYTFRYYTDNPERTSAMKRSISAGFEYQF